MRRYLLTVIVLAAFKIAGAQNRHFTQIVIDSTIQYNSHKPKVLGKFSKDKYNDVGTLDKQGFKLYRYAEDWKPYVIFSPGNPQGFEDAQVADINNDGWNDITIGGWSNQTLWAENPMGKGKDPYITQWTIHMIDSTRFSHEVCVADLNADGKPDVITTSGVYIQGATLDSWTFINIGRNGQGTFAVNILNNKDGFADVIALYRSGEDCQIAWFENPGHTGGNPVKDKWKPHIIDSWPGGDFYNFEMTTMAFTCSDINGDGRVDLVCASQGEGPGPGDANAQVGDGLVWYEAPKDPRSNGWAKHIINPKIGWVHASSIQLADFDGDGHVDINYAQQDQSKDRKDGSNIKQQLGIYYNISGKGKTWRHQIISRYKDYGSGGFNSKIGIVGNDKLPSILTSLHGYFGDANPLILWRNK
ncbi:VCBS repeat-containing protein [Mucilaginibacter panaciglaebae]|uniref:VCBS repeat protein n=1 Tax=Mucilaginibacter panaciglaebae TaxID=502331 RepID=A0ABP7WK38_9SPHI